VLNYTPSMGPASAHIIATQYPSLGCLMTTFLDPSTCAPTSKLSVVCGCTLMFASASRCLNPSCRNCIVWNESFLCFARQPARQSGSHESADCRAGLTCRSDAQKMKLISALEKPTENRRRVGPAAAQKLLRVLTATDPDLPVQG